MFALAERARLAMHRRTLAQAIANANVDYENYAAAMQAAFGVLSGLPAPYSSDDTVWGAIQEIPPHLLQAMDGQMLRLADIAQRKLHDMPSYYAFTILSGIILSRVIEVARPRLAQRAVEHRESALRFAEPLLQFPL